MGTGTFAAVVIVGVMLLLLISTFIRQKKSDEAAIRRKVRSTLIEETTGVSINERLKAKRKSISRPENVDFCELRSAKRLDLPERVDGWLDLEGLTTSRGLKLPERVGGDIYFWSLSKSEYDRLSHGPVRMGGKVRFEPLVDYTQLRFSN
ncbi:MAG: hypothetical protein CME17_08845 [Gemmatimonadetes bacterium]|nr:hypothetical protein [Gemmatimonadota bacterium]|tara:strand:- start:1421 stop:1870 length:450 start_codon:yes stop_codon:yes gene_type:complete